MLHSNRVRPAYAAGMTKDKSKEAETPVVEPTQDTVDTNAGADAIMGTVADADDEGQSKTDGG